ncbi:MAG: hypothetical protein JSR91_24490 [Proteobacteria bacterium]|nr:hypothetical protein [Pseudomonadota bacterium]
MDGLLAYQESHALPWGRIRGGLRENAIRATNSPGERCSDGQSSQRGCDAIEKATSPEARRKVDEKLDQALKDTFPASDPVAIAEPSPDESSDRAHNKDRKSKTGRKRSLG